MADSLTRLQDAILALDAAGPIGARTLKLRAEGRPKMAKKLVEEAAELAIEAMRADREAMVRESADLLYHLVVLWTEAGLRPAEIFAEMAHREAMFGLAEKRRKGRSAPRNAPLRRVAG
jgi:phosphoribosyl-ATP pyrophosphohydrolase